MWKRESWAEENIYFAKWVEALGSEKEVSVQLTRLGRAFLSLEPPPA